jgi:protein SCO1/2
MKKILFPFIIAVVSFINPSCSNQEAAPECCNTGSGQTNEVAAISDESIFLLDSNWESYQGQMRPMSDLNGKIIVAAMFFSNCPSACPRIAADMKNIESGLTDAEREKVQFVLISMDPDRDTPEQMQDFASNHQLNKSWELLRSDKNATMEIANVLGVKIKPLEGGGFDHSNIIHILNQKGEIVYQQMGLNIDPKESLKEIRKII